MQSIPPSTAAAIRGVPDAAAENYYLRVFRYATSACSCCAGMIPPQCGMLTIGARPITLPDRMTAMIFASVLNCVAEVDAGERRGSSCPATAGSARRRARSARGS